MSENEEELRDISFIIGDLLASDKKILMLVAHPDDEVLFGGGILLTYAQGKSNWIVTSCCVPFYPESYNWDSKLNKYRHFEEICKKLGVSWKCLGIPHAKFSGDEILWESIQNMLIRNQIHGAYTGILYYLNKLSPDVIITHNMYGEYRNPVHSLVNAVVRMYKGILAPETVILSFAAHKEDIASNPHFVLELDENIYNKKIELLSMYKGKGNTLKKYGIAHCKKEALWFEDY